MPKMGASSAGGRAAWAQVGVEMEIHLESWGCVWRMHCLCFKLFVLLGRQRQFRETFGKNFWSHLCFLHCHVRALLLLLHFHMSASRQISLLLLVNTLMAFFFFFFLSLFNPVSLVRPPDSPVHRCFQFIGKTLPFFWGLLVSAVCALWLRQIVPCIDEHLFRSYAQ